jgi:predicted transcriptional regulator YdeE
MTNQFEVVEQPAVKLIGLAADFYGGMSPKFNGQQVLGPLWGKVHKSLAGLGIERIKMIGATRTSDSGEEGLLNQFVGAVVAEVPSNIGELEVLALPAMKLATYEHHGSMAGLVATIQKFYGEVLPGQGYARSGDWHLEIYDERYSDEDGSVMVIAVPIA